MDRYKHAYIHNRDTVAQLEFGPPGVVLEFGPPPTHVKHV